MNVTTKGRYALRLMLDLAEHAEDGFVSIRSVARREGISEKYLETIITPLRRERMLESSRGKEGGYRLSRAPEDYSVGEILRAIEDRLAPVSCIRDGSVDCERAGSCRTLGMWKELDELTNAYLDGVSLRDLMTGEKWKYRN